MKILISQKLKDYRKEKGLTQHDLSRLMGVSHQAVSKWEREECFPDITFLPSIAMLLNCKVDDLFL